MAVRLNINADVRGQGQVDRLGRSVQKLGIQANITATRMAGLEAAAVRGRASLALLATTLNIAVIGGLAAAAFAFSSFIKSTFAVGNQVESARIQFNAFFGSVEEGSKAFDRLNEFAAQVPFSLGEIISGGTPLAAISENADQLADNLRIVGNLAAIANIDFATAALQYQRVASAGVAAADLLRDKGIPALLGFVSGAQYTAAESVRAFEEAFGPGGRFGDVTGELARSLKGQISLVEDAYTRFRQVVSARFFASFTNQIRSLIQTFADNEVALNAFANVVGNQIAAAFVKLEEAGSFVVRNFDTISDSIKAIIAYKLAGIVAGITAVFIQWTIAVTATAVRFGILNAIMRANPIGLLITAIQLAVAAFIFFREEINGATRAALEFVNRQFNKLHVAVLRVVQLLNTIPGISIGGDDLQETIDLLNNGIADSLARSNNELTNINKNLRDANQLLRSDASYAFQITQSLTDQVAAVRARLQFQKQISALEGMGRDLLIVQEYHHKRRVDFQQIILNAQEAITRETLEQAAANRENARFITTTVEDYTSIKDVLEQVGVTSSSIGNTITDTWINGLKEGVKLTEILQNTFRNLLNTIVETIVRNTINLAIERLFDVLGKKKIQNEKILNTEKAKGFAISKAEAALEAAGSAVRSIGRLFGFNQGGIVPNTPDSDPNKDSVPALLTPGEIVIPKDLVSAILRNKETVLSGDILGPQNYNRELILPRGIAKALAARVQQPVASRILGLQQGGVVPSTPSSNNNKDTVPVLLQPGELVIPNSLVKALLAPRNDKFPTNLLRFQTGGIVPNTPGSIRGVDSVPALLTPGERVIPVGQSGETVYNTNITQNLSTRNLNEALIEAIRTQAQDVNAILAAERNN